MRLALVTTSLSVHSGIGDYTRHLLPYLAEHFEVSVFTEPGTGGEDYEGILTRPAPELDPREFDRVLYQIGNEDRHAFMLPMLRAIGGTVMLHDWVLFDCAVNTYPGLLRGGVKGHALALREGRHRAGAPLLAQLDGSARREGAPYRAEVGPEELIGELLSGWHAAEDRGRWAADEAYFRVTEKGCAALTVALTSAPGRRVSLHRVTGSQTSPLASEECSADNARVELSADLKGADDPVLCLRTEGIAITDEQRKYGDMRRLGSFVESIEYTSKAGRAVLDLSGSSALPIKPVALDRDRFRLPFNRSVVRFADGFIVHSQYVKRLILTERNAITPVGVLHHGAEERWTDEDRRVPRRELGLDPAWVEGFLVTSFGGVQPHKRIDKLLAAVALAREERDDIYLFLAGKVQADGFDPVRDGEVTRYFGMRFSSPASCRRRLRGKRCVRATSASTCVGRRLAGPRAGSSKRSGLGAL